MVARDGRDRWLARQGHRARIAARDGWRLLSMLVRTLRTAVRDAAPRPGLAFLAGPSEVRRASPATYLIAVCNPTAHVVRPRLVADGWVGGTDPAGFHVEQTIDVPPRATARYRLATSWNGGASLAPEPSGGDPALAAHASVRHDGPHCDVRVRLVDGRTLDALAVRCPIVA